MILTIAIPTYNRPEQVKNTVARLLVQLTENVKILILDNCSDVVISEYITKQLGTEASEKIEIIRNRVNIGADANFLRCVEFCETPFIWMLGDDDKIVENAVELILDELENYKDYDLIGINFNSNCNTVQRTKPITISSTAELATRLDHFGNWLFISTSVYKTREYLKHVRYQLWGAYSMASQLVAPIIAISHHKTFILSEKYLVNNIAAEEDDPGGKWSNVQLALSLSTLLEAPVGFKKDEFISFGRKLETWVGLYPGDAFYIILRSVNYNFDLIDDYHIYLFNQLFSRTILFRSRKTFQYIQYYQCLLLLKNKGLLRLIFKLSPKMKRNSESKAPFSLFKR